ncbi:MAG TPA: hypothetical protein P5162_06410 [Bacteroidia bacterium]|nr:hypothetical protein [Bacteroidota bacterium]HRV52709.1 hypothetical protein [Bacteroidia bacterium]
MKIIIILSILFFLAVIWMTGKYLAEREFDRQVDTLFKNSGEIQNKNFQYSQLQNLPEPVQRYFKLVLPEGQPYISYIRLEHDGQFKIGPDKKWTNIEGEQYFTTQSPGFIWKGSTNMFTARDMFLSGKGSLTVSLFSVIRIVDAKGEKYDDGELLRWLAESVWFPTNFLPSDNLGWTAVNSDQAELIFTFDKKELNYLVTFNQNGEIVSFQTKRYMNEDSLEIWEGKVSSYKRINGMLIPTMIEAVYKLKTGDYSYAKFNLKNIEYDIPQRFK